MVFGTFLFRTWVICQNEKNLVSTYSKKPSLSITQVLNKIKKVPNTLLWTLVRGKCVQKFRKNIKLYGSWSWSKFSKEITWFLGNERALSKFKYWILHHLISIISV